MAARVSGWQRLPHSVRLVHDVGAGQQQPGRQCVGRGGGEERAAQEHFRHPGVEARPCTA